MNSNLSRRTILQAGCSGLAGAGLTGAGWERLQAAGTGRPRRAKACIFLFMWGGPSQLDTFDLKPNAPAEVRGDFAPIATSLPGLQISEHFPRLSRWMDRVALIRSLHHSDPAHLSSGHTTLTGHLAPVVRSDADPPSNRDTPHLGSALAWLASAGHFQPRTDFRPLPPAVSMPWKAYHPSAPGGQAPGQHGGWLGPNWDPFLLTGDPNQPDWNVPALALQQGVSQQRLSRRKDLLQVVDAQRRSLASVGAGQTMAVHQQRAIEFLTSPSVRGAFDLNQEPDDVRERYGRNVHGQCVLLARRLVEQGVPFVNVNWHNDGRNFWDTHGNNFNRLKNDLMPPSDRALSALLEDLERTGMLEDTIVAWVGEFGRRPTITNNNAGREHWPQCYSGLLAGGGIRPGAVFGSSDAHAGYPASDPVTPHDYAATILKAMGIPTDAVIHDRQNRPHQVYAGQPIDALFS